MKELKHLERILNLSIQKGVFQSLQEVAEAINCLDNLSRKISSLEQQIQELQKGANNQ
jgi:hypothetical protein